MAESDFQFSVGADTSAAKRNLDAFIKYLERNSNQNIRLDLKINAPKNPLNQEFISAMQADLQRMVRDAGQIKYDSTGSGSYKNLSSDIDDAFASMRMSKRENDELKRAIIERNQAEIDWNKRAADSERLLTQQRQRSAELAREQSRQRIIELEREQRAEAETNKNIQATLAQRFAGEKYSGPEFVDIATTNKAIEEQINAMPRLRYALYDVANVARQASLVMIGLGAATVTTAASFESSFTAVERTTGAFGLELSNLREELLGISRDIPISFSQVTELAALGAQLGVATEDIAAFAENVAMFSAVTNVSTTQTAQSFGALGELLNITSNQFDSLGSAIAFAGVNAVATETEILSVSTAIAGVSANAGLSAQFVLGLATSLASLRVPAEQSRGALTRVFQEVSRASQEGGAAFEEFARVVGLSVDAASQLANTDMEQFFTRFLNGLSSMDASQLTASLDAMALSDIRVTNTLARLSGNMDVVTESMANVNSAWDSGTYQAEAFGKVADDLNSRFQVLGQNFQELLANLGAPLAGFLGPIVQGVTDALKEFNEVISTDSGKNILGLVVGVVTFVGALSGLVSALALGYAGILAMRTAFVGLSAQSNNANSSLMNLLGAMLRVPGYAGKGSAAIKELSASMRTLSATTGVALNAFKGLVAGVAIAGVFELIGFAIREYEESLKSAQEKQKELAESTFGEAATGSLAEALAKDAKSTEEAIIMIETSFVDAGRSARNYVKDIEQATGGQVQLGESTTKATENIKEQTIAYKENAREALANILANNEGIQSLFANNTFEATGVDSEKLFAAILGDPIEGGRKYLDSVYQGIQQRLGEGSAIDFAEMINLELPGGGFNSAAMIAMLGQELGITAVEAQELLGQYVLLEGVIESTNAQIATAASVAAATAAANSALGESAEEAAEATANQAEEMTKLVDQLFEVVNGAQKTAGALDELGQAFAEGGDQAAIGTGALQGAIQAIIAENPQLAAGKLQFLLDYILANVPGATGTISFLQQAINGLTNGKGAQAIPFDISSFTGGMKKAAKSAGSAAKAVRTLKDYASDLAKVFDRAFDIRFAGLQALDKVTKNFNDIGKAIADARIEIEDINMSINDLNADIQSLSADKALQEYFLSVAEAYGDSLKVGEIRAKLVKIDADLAKKNSELTKKSTDLQKAQDKTNKTLIGNSDAAIENRSEIIGLVKDYQNYIQELASSGLSQDELKAKTSQLKSEFIAQATQLGYNETELQQYAAAFDDVTLAINNVPRNITVTANTDPALQALREFEAQAARSGATAGGNYAAAYEEALKKKARGDALLARISSISAVAQDPKNSAATRIRNADKAQELSNLYNSGQYFDGGYTGAGGKYDVAGVVHRGEYVVPKEQVNQRTGMPYFMEQPRSFAQGGYVGSGPSTMMVMLSPEDRAILRNAGGSGNIVLYADSKELARSVNDGNRQIVATGGRQ